MQTKTGVQKVLCTILTDQLLWVPGTKKQQALQFLFQKDDFDPEMLSSILYETFKSLGGWLNFVPK